MVNMMIVNERSVLWFIVNLFFLVFCYIFISFFTICLLLTSLILQR